MVKSNKKKVRTNLKTRKNINKNKTKENQKGGGVSYEQSQLLQIRGKCDKYNEVSVGKPGIAGCECIVENGAVGGFDFPTNMFECNPSSGLKVKPNSADPYYLRYNKLNAEAFGMSKEDFKFYVNDELQKLFDEVGGITTEALQFIVDFTLDPGKHEGRIYKNGLNKKNLETLIDNLDLIKAAVEKAKFNENIRFKDILGFLQDLLNTITKQHEAMSKYYKKNKELIKKMEKPPVDKGKEREERKKEEEEKNDKSKRRRRQRNSNSSKNSNNFGSKDENKLKDQIKVMLKTGVKAPQQFYDDEEILDYIFVELQNEFDQYSLKDFRKDLQRPNWLEYQIVRLVFDFVDNPKDTGDMVKKLDIKSIIKLIQGFLAVHYSKDGSKYKKRTAEKYTEEFISRFGIETPKAWIDAIKEIIKDEEEIKSREQLWEKFAEIIGDEIENKN